MNMKAAHRALLQAARDRATITHGEIVGLAGLTLTGDPFATYLVTDVNDWQTWLSSPSANLSVAHEDRR